MKKIKNILRTTVMMLVLGSSLCTTSCTDYLTIYPTNTVTHDDYWQTKDDVLGMLAAAYNQLISGSAVQRYLIWGEARADALAVREGKSQVYNYIMESYLTDENSFCDWSTFYKAINYANMVLEFAPQVVDRDPDFTDGDLQVVQGEMYALRALCHFYLLRTFRDIPLSFQANIEDANIPDYPQVHPTVALDSIMHDLDRAQGLVMRSYKFPKSTPSYNFGRITSNAVLAMKADVALWQAAFAKYYAENGTDSDKEISLGNPDDYYALCAECCSLVINSMNEYYIETFNITEGSNANVGEGSDNPYYLISNVSELSNKKNSVYQSIAYDQIFGAGNSVESIFELQFDENTNTNDVLVSFYGVDDGSIFYVPESFLSSNELAYNSEDWRLNTFIAQPEASSSSSSTSNANVIKYMVKSSGPATATGPNGAERVYHTEGECSANWIVYRKTDVMLMWAEALSHMTTAEANIEKAFELCKAVNDRSMHLESAKLKASEYTSATAVADLVLDERARELIFEGKRWYDLVRKALRDGTTSNITFVADKTSIANTVKNRMAHINSLFFPISESELDVNPLLSQNPAYESSSSIEQN